MSEAERFYLDTSALLPYYREESVSRKIQDLLISFQPPVIISDLVKVEFASALARWVRMDEILEEQAVLLEKTFTKDVNAGLFLSKPMKSTYYSQAERWITSRKTALRTLDALHLACSWSLDAELVTCDRILHQAAKKLGVPSRLV
ncbi:type II toxin-antitoxin system VapC family toxin [Desulfosarcina ovata]|jgi:predicted nucleic acid-binding protein|uniref:Ribonuclease VapC n=1 Tax=Desulfosarcina ovata subsp. ovata TaxID=2752305 RepID=A0A5K8A6C3_9BACT|nr:type II toxin-antitoxin system VapC family toxin [Desulfosarcina ovata]BBO88162.1 ribonuclease VapC [Desulfosarcina ovata subsp. ovata]